ALPFDIGAKERWQNAVHWARWLGYVSRVNLGKHDMVASDPTAALCRHLSCILANKPPRPVGVVLDEVAARVCVFEGGRARDEIEAKLRTDNPRGNQELSPATTFALARLQTQGVLHAEIFDDAIAWTAVGLPRGRLTHLAWVRAE